jgi:PiT family inorganic phosphate transporter
VLSPVIAVAFGATLYLLFRFLRLRLGIQKEWCVCVGETRRVIPIPQPGSVIALQAVAPALEITAGEALSCAQRYAGSFLGVNCQRLMDAAHILSAGVVSFARGLNDTPKIAALLLVISSLEIRWGLVAVAMAMAVGGLLKARKVAETMSHKITGMNHGQGFSANLATGILVIFASNLGLPVSTTHVSVGSLLGIGLTTRQADLKVVRNILMSWVVTLPFAAAISALAYWLITR